MGSGSRGGSEPRLAAAAGQSPGDPSGAGLSGGGGGGRFTTAPPFQGEPYAHLWKPVLSFSLPSVAPVLRGAVARRGSAHPGLWLWTPSSRWGGLGHRRGTAALAAAERDPLSERGAGAAVGHCPSCPRARPPSTAHPHVGGSAGGGGCSGDRPTA